MADVQPLLFVSRLFYSVRMTLQALDELIYLVQLTGDADALRAMRFALAALDAVIGLAVAWHHAVEGDEILTTMFAIFRITDGIGQ